MEWWPQSLCLPWVGRVKYCRAHPSPPPSTPSRISLIRFGSFINDPHFLDNGINLFIKMLSNYWGEISHPECEITAALLPIFPLSRARNWQYWVVILLLPLFNSAKLPFFFFYLLCTLFTLFNEVLIFPDVFIQVIYFTKGKGLKYNWGNQCFDFFFFFFPNLDLNLFLILLFKYSPVWREENTQGCRECLRKGRGFLRLIQVKLKFLEKNGEFCKSP